MTRERIGIYMRVSTQDQSTDLQRYELEAYATSRGWGQLAWYEDKATGTHTNRPRFRELMADAKARKIDVVLVWKLDRFARSLKDLILSLQDLADLGVAFVSLKDQLDLTTSVGKLMLHVIGAFAQFEADIIKDRVRSGLAAAKARGSKLGRPRRLDPVRVIELRRQGKSLSQIARALGTTKSAVSKILRRQGVSESVTKPELIEDVEVIFSRGENK